MDKPAGSITRRLDSKHLAEVDADALVAELLGRVRAVPPGAANDWPMRLKRTAAWLAAELNVRLLDQINAFHHVKTDWMLRCLTTHPAFERRRIRGATFVELGCGGLSPFPHLVTMLACGADRSIGIDLDELVSPVAAARAAYDTMAALTLGLLRSPALPEVADIQRNLRGIDAAALWRGELGSLSAGRARFDRRPADETGLEPSSAGLTYSNSFLEHVPDIATIARELARITGPGGLGVHFVDGSDHRRYVDPSVGMVEFLEDPQDCPIVHGSNRLRPMIIATVFREAGFDVSVKPMERTRITVDAAFRSRLAPQFVDLPDETLSVTSALLFLTKRG